MYYALRWVMVLMSQDLEMPSCIRLWDTLFADEQRFDFLHYVAASIILQCRETILEGDFAKTMHVLQNFLDELDDVTVILQEAWDLQSKLTT